MPTWESNLGPHIIVNMYNMWLKTVTTPLRAFVGSIVPHNIECQSPSLIIINILSANVLTDNKNTVTLVNILKP